VLTRFGKNFRAKSRQRRIHSYDLFISYSQSDDREFIRCVERTLWSFGRAWYQLRGLRTYRDETNLAAEPDLWLAIENAIKRSNCLVLVASPRSARSHWVVREVQSFAREKGVGGLCIIQISGTLPSTDSIHEQTWFERDDAAVHKTVWELLASSGREPLVIDLRPFRSIPERQRLKDADYLSRLASLAAKALAKDKETIWGYFHRAQRIRTTVLGTVICVLLAMSVALTFALLTARQQTREARRQRSLAEGAQKVADAQRDEARKQQAIAEDRRRVARSQQLASDSRALLGTNDDLAMLLSIESYRMSATPESKTSLLYSLQGAPYVKKFLHQRVHHELAINDPFAARDDVLSVAFHPNGKLLASGTFDGMFIWDLETGKPLTTISVLLPQQRDSMQGNYVEFRSLQFNPSGTILGAELSGTIYRGKSLTVSCFWETRSWKRIGLLKGSFKGFGPDGKPWIDQSEPPDMRFLETKSSKLSTHTWMAPAKTKFHELPLSNDKKLSGLITTDLDAYASVVWDPRSQALQTINPESCQVVAFNPRKRVLTCAEKNVSFIDIDTGAPVQPDIHTDSFDHIVASEAGQLIAAAKGSAITLWSVDTQRQVGSEMRGHRTKVNALAFSPDGSTIASGSDDGDVILWHVFVPQPEGKAPGGRRILKARHTFGQPMSLTKTQSEQSNVAAFMQLLATQSADVVDINRADTLFVANTGGSVFEWSFEHGDLLKGPLELFPGGLIHALAVNPDGSVLAAAGFFLLDGADERKIELIQLPSGKLLRTIQCDEFNALAFSPDGELLIAACGYKRLFVDLLSGNISIADSPVPLLEPRRVAFCPGGACFVVSGLDGSELWDVSRRKVIRVLSRSEVTAVAFSSDGRIFAAANEGGVVQIQDASDYHPMAAAFEGGAGTISALRFDRDSKILAIAGHGVQLWDVDNKRKIGAPLTTPPFSIADEVDFEFVEGVAFSPEAKNMYTVLGDSHSIVTWNLDPESWVPQICGIANRNMTPVEWGQFMKDEIYRPTCPVSDAGPVLTDSALATDLIALANQD